MMKKFIRQNIDHQPIVDNVFKIVSLANDAIAKKGKENSQSPYHFHYRQRYGKRYGNRI